jgi:hypothetical protein
VHPKWFPKLWYIWHKPYTYLALKLTLSPNGPKQASIWASSPRRTIWCIQNNFWAYGTFGTNRAPTMHRNWHYLQKDRKEILHDPHHLGVPTGASETVYEAMVHLVQTIDLSCTETNTISKWTETRFYMTHIPLGYHPGRPKQFMRLWYIWCKPCTYLALKLTLSPNGPKQASIWATSPRSTIRCIQNNFWAYDTFGQTMHLPCIETNAVSERTKRRFYMTHVT